jgi:hypothetical protein
VVVFGFYFYVTLLMYFRYAEFRMLLCLNLYFRFECCSRTHLNNYDAKTFKTYQSFIDDEIVKAC